MNHQPDEKASLRKTIYYDGSCSMCASIIKKVDHSSKREKFNSKDITKGPFPKNISKSQLQREIHVIDSDGKIYKNAEGILKILEEYPKWKLLVKFGRLPIIRQILAVGYRLIAANRHSLFVRSYGKDHLG